MSLGSRQSPNVKRGQKGEWPGSRDPVKFGALNANSFKKIWHGCSQESPDMTPEKFFRKEAWPGPRDPLNFGGLSASSYKMVKAIPYGLQICVSSDKARIGNFEYSE